MGHLISVQKDYIDVTYVGLVTYSDRIRAIEVLAPTLLKTTLRRVLVDFDNSILLDSDSEARNAFVEKVLGAPELQGCQIALVGPTETYARITELAAIVRHIPIKMFTDRESAIRWLTS